MTDHRPIAVFDSGLGGLTVVRAVRRRLPAESIIYFGDTARVPYGIKSSPTVSRFAVEIVRFLLQFNPKAVVVACNTASAVALEALHETFIDLPIWNVIQPGARTAAALARRGPVALLATEATVASQAYPREIRRLNRDAQVVSQAAPLLVPLVEEGRPLDDPVVRAVVEGYLAPVLEQGPPAGVLLGCTHYPLLAPVIARALGPGIELIDSAEQTAAVLADELPRRGLAANAGTDGRPRAVVAAKPDGRDEARPSSPDGRDGAHPSGGRLTCLVSDNAERFERIGSRFLGQPIGQVRYVGPDEFFAVAQPPADEPVVDVDGRA